MRIFLPFTVLLVIFSYGVTRAEDDKKAQVDVAAQDDSWAVPAELTMRARVAAMTPEQPVSFDWRIGGEGLGGMVTRGTLAAKINVREWTEPVPVKSFVKGKFPGKLFVTFTCNIEGKRGKGAAETTPRNFSVEFEFSFQGKPVKTFVEQGPDGGTVGIVIPAYRLSGGKNPESPEFLTELSGLQAYAERRFALLSAARPNAAQMNAPKLFSIVSNLGGYGEGTGYGIRHTNKSMVDIECKTLRLLGLNGFAQAPKFLHAKVAAREDGAKDFAHALYEQLGGYPVPAVRKNGPVVPEAGCPFAPGVAARQAATIESGIAEAKQAQVDEVWWRTEDEIGSVFDRAPEGKSHLAVCPLCAEAFRQFLKKQKLAPADFDAVDWSAVKPFDIWKKDTAAPATRAEKLNAYYGSMFANEASAQLFTPMRNALAKLNEEKIRTHNAAQPFVYAFALRGNTFLMGGHSLDFFDFYRHADNAFVYEMSNRDARVWEWDSYLCDVGRVVSEHQHLKFGVYVKPHRGAPIQRTLAAASRGDSLLYWYTYGPDYVKGDSFAANPENLVDISRAAELIAKAENTIYGAKWAHAPEVAVVNPRSSEIWARINGASPAAYENAKWIYAALQHAHIPVDPIDEVMLATEDLSRYKVIYISGANLTRAAAASLVAWVENGGILYTSGGGLARDEADQPLEILKPLLGLKERKPVELFYKVTSYGAGQLERFDETARVLAEAKGGDISWNATPASPLKPVVGREILEPAEGTKVLASFKDGAAAITRHTFGKGAVYVAGFFPGLEYSATVRRDDFDMSRDFSDTARAFISMPALERVAPIVDASQPLVEGVLVKNETSGKRAIVLMNWSYSVTEKHVANNRARTIKGVTPFKELSVSLNSAENITGATSLTLGQPLKCITENGKTVITLPVLNEGDVLLLE